MIVRIVKGNPHKKHLKIKYWIWKISSGNPIKVQQKNMMKLMRPFMAEYTEEGENNVDGDGEKCKQKESILKN